jgi:uncharacterized protein YciI
MRIWLLLSAMAFTMASYSQEKTTYDPALAKKWGADEYGMKQYVMAFLKKGSQKVDSTQRTQLIQGHLKNIGRLAKEGKLLLAGPFLDNGDLAGIFVFNVTTIEEARKLVATDPAVKAGLFDMELHPWYGSASLMEVVNLHNKGQKNSITD